MANKEVKIKRRKGDKTPTYYDPIYDGVNDEPVFIFYFNPDQMARVIEELFNLYLFAKPEPDELIKSSWPIATVAEFRTSKESVGKAKDQTQGSASTLEEVYDDKLFR